MRGRRRARNRSSATNPGGCGLLLAPAPDPGPVLVQAAVIATDKMLNLIVKRPAGKK